MWQLFSVHVRVFVRIFWVFELFWICSSFCFCFPGKAHIIQAEGTVQWWSWVQLDWWLKGSCKQTGLDFLKELLFSRLCLVAEHKNHRGWDQYSLHWTVLVWIVLARLQMQCWPILALFTLKILLRQKRHTTTELSSRNSFQRCNFVPFPCQSFSSFFFCFKFLIEADDSITLFCFSLPFSLSYYESIMVV